MYKLRVAIHVAGAVRNGKLCGITKFSQEVVKNGR